MLAMQKEVREGVRCQEGHRDAPTSERTEDQRSLQLADREDEIVRGPARPSDVEAEGSAVAFPEVFTQIRSDMINVSSGCTGPMSVW
jgi:hypothetical protein